MNEKEQLLAELKDVHVPPVGVWPAFGWWLLLAIAAVLLLLVIAWYQRRNRLYWQQQARAEIAHIRAQISEEPAVQILAQCSALARRLLLARYPRKSIAALQGEAWLQQLDHVCRQPLFSQGSGLLLLNHPYQADPPVSKQELHGLIDRMDTLLKSITRRSVKLSSMYHDK